MVFFPPASPHARSMLLATVVGAVERSFVFRGFHVCVHMASRYTKHEPELFYFQVISQEASVGFWIRGELMKLAKLR